MCQVLMKVLDRVKGGGRKKEKERKGKGRGGKERRKVLALMKSTF